MNLTQYKGKTEMLLGLKVEGVDEKARIPDEGAVVIDTVENGPSTVRLGYIGGGTVHGIGMRDLDEIKFKENALFCKGDWLRNIHTDDRYRVERVDGFDAIIRLKDGTCIRISEDQQKHWEILKQNAIAESHQTERDHE